MSRRADDELYGIPVYYDSSLPAGYVRLFSAVSPLVPFQVLDAETQRAWRIASGLDRACYIAQSRDAIRDTMHAITEGRR